MYTYISVGELKNTAMQVFEKLTYLTGKWKVEIRYQNLHLAFSGLFQMQRRKVKKKIHSYGKKQTNKQTEVKGT